MLNATENKYKGCAAELVAAFYMNAFIILRPLIVSYSYRWSIILPLIVMPLAMVSVVHRNFKINVLLLGKLFAFICVVTSLFLIDFLLRWNKFTWENYYSFLIHGAITGFLLANVRRYDQLLKYWTIFSIIAGVLYIPDPFNHYSISGGYMSFGSGMLPAFIATVIVFSHYRIKLIAPLMIVFFVETVVYANKGATVSAMAIVAFFIVFNTENKKKRIKRIMILLILSILLLLFLNTIFEIFNMIAVRLGVGSYALTDFSKIFRIKELSSFNSRRGIWDQVGEEFRSHWFFGMGIGGFQNKYNNYAHNFFMDLFITHGVIIGGLILWQLFRYVKNTMKFIKYNKELFLFTFSILLLWFFPSQFSFTYWKLDAFWVFIIVNIYNKTCSHIANVDPIQG